MTIARKIKRAVEFLKSKYIDQADVFPTDHRPRGKFESLVLADYFQVNHTA